MSKTILSLLLATSCSVTAAAQQCTDSDKDVATSGNNPFLRGNVTVVSSTGGHTQYWDTCDTAGRTLREFFCASSGTVLSVTHQGPFGCLDGAVVQENSDSPACFADILVAITPDASSSNPPKISVLKATREIDRLWWAAARSKPQHNDSVLEVVIGDGAGNILATRYSSVVPEYFDIPSTRAISRVTLPFIPNARAVVFKMLGAELAYVLPTPLLTCSRPKVPVGLSGIEGIQWCVPEGQKLPLNATTFTCMPAPAPSPSPGAAAH